mmetsp:Transcript_39118/g.84356  ORF Transcript_39118/g.84356 Transcript_39118/m.84356 type:complete len:441 (+) Transcript_39118:360-1682(+)
MRRQRTERNLLRHRPRARQRLQPKSDRRQRIARDLPHRIRSVGTVRQVHQRRDDRLGVRQRHDGTRFRRQVHQRAHRGELLLVILPHRRRAQQREHGAGGETDLARGVRAQVLDGADGPHPILADLGLAAQQERVNRAGQPRQSGVVAWEAGEVAQHLDAPRVQRAVEDAREVDDVLEQCVVRTQRGGVGAVFREVGERRARAQLALGQEVGGVFDVELLQRRDLHFHALLLLHAPVVLVRAVVLPFLGPFPLGSLLVVGTVALLVAVVVAYGVGIVRPRLIREILGERAAGPVREGPRVRVGQHPLVVHRIETLGPARHALAPLQTRIVVLAALRPHHILAALVLVTVILLILLSLLAGRVHVLPGLTHRHQISQHGRQVLHASHETPVPGCLPQRRQRRRGAPSRLPRILPYHLHQRVQQLGMLRHDQSIVLRLGQVQ